MADDKTLSETIIDQATVLQQWDEMRPITDEVKSLVQEYSQLIDGISSAFAVVGFIWNIYSNMEKAKQSAAQQQNMVHQITRAGMFQPIHIIGRHLVRRVTNCYTVDGMINRATADIKHHFDKKEVEDAVNAVNAVQQGFRHDVLPYAKTFPLTGFDLAPLDHLINDARKVIETLHNLIAERAKDGDGAAIIVLYRNLHAVVQCKLTLDKWRRGLTQAVVDEAKYETTRLIQVWVPVVRGLEYMSDRSFSQGLVHFHVGGHGRPEFSKYSVYYQGKALPGGSSDKAAVSQLFIAVRKAARTNVIPKELFEWNSYPYKVLQQLQEFDDQVPPSPSIPVSLDSKSWYKVNSVSKPGMALDVVNDGNQQRDGRLQIATEGNFSGQFWQFRPSATLNGAYNLCNMWLGAKMVLDVSSDGKRPHLAAVNSLNSQQWYARKQANGTWSLISPSTGGQALQVHANGSELVLADPKKVHPRDPRDARASQWNLVLVRPITESGFDL